MMKAWQIQPSHGQFQDENIFAIAHNTYYDEKYNWAILVFPGVQYMNQQDHQPAEVTQYGHGGSDRIRLDRCVHNLTNVTEWNCWLRLQIVCKSSMLCNTKTNKNCCYCDAITRIWMTSMFNVPMRIVWWASTVFKKWSMYKPWTTMLWWLAFGQQASVLLPRKPEHSVAAASTAQRIPAVAHLVHWTDKTTKQINKDGVDVSKKHHQKEGAHVNTPLHHSQVESY